MCNDNRKALAEYRIKSAKEKYDTAVLLFNKAKYKDSVNRAYYSIFDAMRAVLAIEAVDFKKHSALIS